MTDLMLVGPQTKCTTISKGKAKVLFLLPFQAEDAIENTALSVSTLQDKHAAQDVEVQLVFWD